jgi:hypothetical protein
MLKTAKFFTVLTTLALCFASINTAYADSPSFTYLEAEYIASGDINVSDDSLSVSVDTDGYALNASLELGIFVIQASRFELEGDALFDSKLEDSISTVALGLAFGFPQSKIYGLIRARKDELSLTGAGFDEDEDGTSVGYEIGARVNLTDRFEVNASLGAPSIDEGSAFTVGAQFFVMDNVGLTFEHTSLELEEDDITAEIDTTSVGVRLSF